jgi:hypothetical protein
MAWRANRDIDLLHAEAQIVAEQLGTLWIDKIEVVLATTKNTNMGGAKEELARIIAERTLLPDDPAVREDVDRLLKHLPRELRGLLGDSEEETKAAIAASIQQGAAEVLGRLDENGD